MAEQRRVRLLNPDVARKIAAGEVIDRPSAIVRELMDNAVDSGATKISVEITSGGIEKIRVVDNGCGMSKEDLESCARPHATSKISTETDLMNLTTLGFRGEALSSMAAVSRLEIVSGGWKMQASVTQDHILSPGAMTGGTIVQTQGLFENFPARRQFLKRPASEGVNCRNIFEEKVLPRPDIAFKFVNDGEEKLSLEAGQTLKQRFIRTMEFFESEALFHEIEWNRKDSPDHSFSFHLIIGDPEVTRSSRKDILIYVNGRRINEYSLVQAIVYGCQGYFPNGTFPVACIFIEIDPALVDFNIHPAKKEVRFKDIGPVHHAISTATKNFFKTYTVQTLIKDNFIEEPEQINELKFESNVHSPVSYSSVKYNDSRSRFFNKSTFNSETSRKTATFASDMASRAIKEITPPAPDNSESDFKPNYVPETNDDGFHFVGLTLGTFIIAEKNEVLYIIDQHAAHERILYNRIVAECGQKQKLLVPYIIRTDSIADDNYIEAIKDKLEQSGFTCSKAEEGLWEFTTVPVRWKGTEADLKKDVLDRRIDPSDMINMIAASTACRSAVMDGTVLDPVKAEEIARQALELPDPHCPHGRPVFTTITRKQLFSLVKRT